MRPELLTVAAVFATIIVFAACAIGRTLLRQRRRSRRIRQAAQKIGFSFEGDGRSLLEQGVTGISIFSLASLRHGEIANLLRGQSGSFSVAVCDYHYWAGGGGRRFDHEQTVFCFDVKRAGFADFFLRPRLSAGERERLAFGLKLARVPAAWLKPFLRSGRIELLDRALAAAEEKGVELPGHPGFSARYQLRAFDAEAVKALFQESVVGAFEWLQREPPVSVEKAGDWLVVYRKNVLVRPEDLGAALSEAASIRALFPTLGG